MKLSKKILMTMCAAILTGNLLSSISISLIPGDSKDEEMQSIEANEKGNPSEISPQSTQEPPIYPFDLETF